MMLQIHVCGAKVHTCSCIPELDAHLAGDQEGPARAVAGAVGIDAEHVHAGIKPAGKAAMIKQLQGAGRRVAMVGDGANDAAALAQVGMLCGLMLHLLERPNANQVVGFNQADVGIAMGGGVDAAAEVANIVLLGDRVPQVACLAERGMWLFDIFGSATCALTSSCDVGARCLASQQSDIQQDPAEPLLGFCVQSGRHPAGGRRAAADRGYRAHAVHRWYVSNRQGDAALQ